MTKEKVQIIHEDAQMLVFNKPSGMVVNISNTSPKDTLQSYLQQKLAKNLEKADPKSEFYSRSGLVHRLDKETSGVIVAAKNEGVFEKLKEQFMSREVEKEYVALVFGEIDEEKIEINAPIARNPRKRIQMAVVGQGREAVTLVEKIKVLPIDDQKMTLVRVFPKTGRTHQIRVHLAAMNHPVVGDNLYAGRKRSAVSRSKFGRLMLHAHKITFKHPKDGESVTFEAPLPSNLSY
jgi:23S rRNA pseudouridine1911/1915/1917 synthase